MSNQSDMMQQVEAYRAKVAAYEALRHRIHDLLSVHHGGTDGLTAEDMHTYRELARQRDETLNEMRWLEQKLLDDEALQ